jgi:hypothetical protein
MTNRTRKDPIGSNVIKRTGDIIPGNLAIGNVQILAAGSISGVANQSLFIGGVPGTASVSLPKDNTPLFTTITSNITANGVLFPVQAPAASLPAYVEGGLVYDTTIHRLRCGTASAYAPVNTLNKVVLTPSANVSVDATLGTVFTDSPTQDQTLTISQLTALTICIVFTSDGASRVITFGAGFLSAGTLNLGAVAGKKFVVHFICDSVSFIETMRTGAL